jgi:hypothetical protein
MIVYMAEDGTFHVRVCDIELRQHYFTEDSAIAAGSSAMTHAVLDELTHRVSA